MASELQKPTLNDMGGLPQLHCRQRRRGVPPRGAAPRRAGGVWSVRVVQWEYHLQMGRDFPTSIFFEVVSIKRI